ncbi:MAG: hypothetical protein ACK5QI_02915, partial [Alphaproteobacteria bacterium]
KINWDYEILKATSERRPEHMIQDVVHIFYLMEAMFPKNKSSDAERNAALASMKRRAEYLAADGLIRMGSSEMKDYKEYNGMIQSITPEGRVVLERMENNRFIIRIIGFAAVLLVALAPAIFESFF